MKKQPIFRNREMTELLDRYSHHQKSAKLRAEIMEKTYPLIDAAISRKMLYSFRDDLRQECALKVLTALAKYERKRGTAFEFLWSTICNSLITHGKRMSKSNLSIDSEESVRREAEIAQPARFLNPDRSLLRKLLFEAMNSDGGSLRVFPKEMERAAVDFLVSAALSGDLFSEKGKVLKQLRRYKIRKRDSQFFVDYVLVQLRAKLYSQRVLADELASNQAV